MRKTFVFIVLAIALPQFAAAAVQYEFRQSVRNQMQQSQPTDVTGRGLIDGTKSRIDFHSGSIYGPGTYLVSQDGGKRLTVISDTDQTYAELDIGAMASSLGNQQIKISNLKSNFKKMDDKPIVAGLPTDHYRLTATYEVTLAFGELLVRQSVETVVDKWLTTAFGDVAQNFFASGLLKTGNPELDQILLEETGKFPGFPLRQVVTVTTRAEDAIPSKTKIPLKATRSQVSEVVITAIEAKDIPPTQFKVPAGYKKIERPKALERNAAQNVTLQ